ncbi:CsbD family protein [Methylovulum psychrotolerans]|uniref:General stress protein CsbD n=1 Tax=Methylovulum psychrotolerans TaxID=1704499 RepID=A0A2S5CKT7_9GAMM|nr:CsbD family protein [Methylovulum psychrotolerans]POZ51430.1 general stress protein CsbD [Methylovulum psychrotolerans]
MDKKPLHGQSETAKGRGKQAAGKMPDDKATEADGNVQKTPGKLPADVGNLKETVKKGCC